MAVRVCEEAADLASRIGGTWNVHRAQYASPFNILTEIPTLAPGVPILAVLFYLVKRMFGLDLEIRAYRAEKRAELFEAQRRANAAEELAALPPYLDPQMPRVAQYAVQMLESRIESDASKWTARDGALIWSSQSPPNDSTSGGRGLR